MIVRCEEREEHGAEVGMVHQLKDIDWERKLPLNVAHYVKADPCDDAKFYCFLGTPPKSFLPLGMLEPTNDSH